jgi:threonine/homoserine/homoserine lactone efflux protein
MSLHLWTMYLATTFVVSAIPGPNMLLVMTHGARHGVRRSMATMAGCLTALIIMQAISAAGLGVLLTAWPTLFNTLRLLGAAYLIYLGVKSWRALPSTGEPVDNEALRLADSVFGQFQRGFLVASSNPKAILFAAALLPQFISAAEPKLPQFVVLIVTFSVVEIAWYFVYSVFGARIGAQLRSASVSRLFNRLTGGIFVGFGTMMALVRH